MLHTGIPCRAKPLTRSVPLRVTCAALLLGGWIGGVGPQAHAAPSATVVEAVQLPAWVERDGHRLPAEAGAQLRDNDKTITANGSRMRLRMDEHSVIKLGEQTELLILSTDTSSPSVVTPSEQKSSLKLLAGVFRYATTSKLLDNTRELRVDMANTTVTTRGTDIWNASNAELEAVCVFEGRADVMRDAKPTIELDKPGALWMVYTNEPEKPADQATPAQWVKFMGQTDMQAGSGVLLQGGRWRAVAALLNSKADADALRTRLQTAGYPAETKAKDGRHEVRINQLATRADADALLKQLRSDTALGVSGGRVALAAH